MDLLESNIVYTLRQQVERLEREGAGAPTRTEAYAREGLLLVRSRLEPTGWWRQLAEYELGGEYVAAARAKVYVERAEMREQHLKLVEKRTLEFGPEVAMSIDSDVRGTDPALAVAGRPALPGAMVGHPGVAPSAPDQQPEIGRPWDGVVRLRHGFGEFKMKYSAVVKAREFAATTIEVSLKPDKVRVAGEFVVLAMTATGRWTVSVPRLERLPQVSEGTFEIKVSQQVGQPDKTVQDVELSRTKCTFKYERVPVSFDEKRVYPAAWQRQLTHPVDLPPTPPTPPAARR